MTDERTPERDPRLDPDRSSEETGGRDEDRPESDRNKKNPSPWTREGPDAPDAADIENPDEQR